MMNNEKGNFARRCSNISNQNRKFSEEMFTEKNSEIPDKRNTMNSKEVFMEESEKIIMMFNESVKKVEHILKKEKEINFLFINIIKETEALMNQTCSDWNGIPQVEKLNNLINHCRIFNRISQFAEQEANLKANNLKLFLDLLNMEEVLIDENYYLKQVEEEKQKSQEKEKEIKLMKETKPVESHYSTLNSISKDILNENVLELDPHTGNENLNISENETNINAMLNLSREICKSHHRIGKYSWTEQVNKISRFKLKQMTRRRKKKSQESGYKKAILNVNSPDSSKNGTENFLEEPKIKIDINSKTKKRSKNFFLVTN